MGWHAKELYALGLLALMNVFADARIVDFVDESAQVAADLEQVHLGGSSESNRRPSRKLSRTKTAERIPQRSSNASNLATEHSSKPPNFAIIGTSLLSGQPVVATSSPLHTRFQQHRHSSPATSSISSLDGNSSIDWHHDAPTSSWNLLTKEPIRTSWPLSDPIEAHLFRVFVDGFARRWDSYNSHDIFTTQIPQMALANPMLLDAIFMKASQTICRTDASFPAKPYVYHERLVQQLIPYLANHGPILDEATLVAAILLRGFEEFHGKSACSVSSRDMYVDQIQLEHVVNTIFQRTSCSMVLMGGCSICLAP